MESSKTEYVRLTETFLANFNWKQGGQGGLTRDGFREWARSRREVPVRIDPHKWRPMREGMPVPKAMVEALSEYLSKILRRGNYPVSEISSPCDPRLATKPKDPAAGRDFWRLGWRELLAFLAGYSTPAEEAYCENEHDVTLAATMIIECVGAREGRAASGNTAIAVGESLMKQTCGEYARWLLASWKANENTVLFAVQKEEHGLARVGVSVVVPVTEGFYLRFRNGQAEATDATENDIAVPSKYILFAAAADNQAMDIRVERAGRSMPQLLTTVYQVAALCPPLHQDGNSLIGIGYEGTLESRRRLEAYGFKDVGTKTPRKGRAILEVVPPDLKNPAPASVAQYRAMVGTIEAYQAAIRGLQAADRE